MNINLGALVGRQEGDRAGPSKTRIAILAGLVIALLRNYEVDINPRHIQAATLIAGALGAMGFYDLGSRVAGAVRTNGQG